MVGWSVWKRASENQEFVLKWSNNFNNTVTPPPRNILENNARRENNVVSNMQVAPFISIWEMEPVMRSACLRCEIETFVTKH